jgi:1-acyl-sn-glycerol-3-phosphate acyltransferase
LSYEAYRRTLTPVIRAVYRVEVRGAHNVPLEGPLVATGNHDSIVDPFLMAAVVPRPIHFVGKSELWRFAPLAWWLGTVGAIPVVRGGSDLEAIASAVAVLEAGEAVGIFPEGGVKRDGPWLRGAARMALATGAPLLPIRFLETRKAVGRGTVGLPRLVALIGEPISVPRADPTPELARTLTDRLQAAVESLGT